MVKREGAMTQGEKRPHSVEAMAFIRVVSNQIENESIQIYMGNIDTIDSIKEILLRTLAELDGVRALKPPGCGDCASPFICCPDNVCRYICTRGDTELPRMPTEKLLELIAEAQRILGERRRT
jgi:MoaA/NifB/PqqE/SkfB family radical SAM enzyme